MKPIKRRRGVGPPPETNNLLVRIYLAFWFLQPFQLPRPRDAFRREDIRRCVVCRSAVRNENLGGFDSRSAMTGALWCYSCAD